jgi:hypothetical protein
VGPFSRLEAVKAVPATTPQLLWGIVQQSNKGRAMGIVSDIEKTLQIPRLGTALLAVLFGALLLMIPWLLNYLVAIGLIIWGIAEAVKASNASKRFPSSKGSREHPRNSPD